MKTKVILCDIEGTTTDINFVHRTLFPYAKERIESFLKINHDLPEIAKTINHIQQVVMHEENRHLDLDGVILKLLDWIQMDRKETNLKIIQGLIWEEGYLKGDLLSHVYNDVPAQFKKWQESGIEIDIYSSGSIHAQKLLFKHTTFGDLTPYITHYFDTNVGGKRESKSYQKIVTELKCHPDDILFLSDIKEELDAAKASGLSTTQLFRSFIKNEGHISVTTFDQISL